MDFRSEKILSKTKNYLNDLLAGIESIEINEKQKIAFHSNEFRDSETLNPLIEKRIEKTELPIIYTIELEQINLLPTLLECFEDFSEKNKKKTKNKDRVNISKYNKTLTKYLYVGSSTTDFYSRIKNHLGTRGTRVYSLHLCKWDNALSYNIIFYTYEIQSVDNSRISQIMVEIIEQQIWDSLKPNFGKRSGQ